MSPETALVAVGGLHLGFQAVVTIVVYPALAATRPADWDAAHDAHSRRISYVVAPLYLVVAAACLWVLVAGPHTVWPMVDRKSTRLNSSHCTPSRMPSSA